MTYFTKNQATLEQNQTIGDLRKRINDVKIKNESNNQIYRKSSSRNRKSTIKSTVKRLDPLNLTQKLTRKQKQNSIQNFKIQITNSNSTINENDTNSNQTLDNKFTEINNQQDTIFSSEQKWVGSPISDSGNKKNPTPNNDQTGIWKHDRFNIEEQKPKSEKEIVRTYGFDIRKAKNLSEVQVDNDQLIRSSKIFQKNQKFKYFFQKVVRKSKIQKFENSEKSQNFISQNFISQFCAPPLKNDKQESDRKVRYL